MASSAYYYVTGSAGNQKTLTLSGWFKVASFDSTTFFSYHDQVSGSSARSEIFLNASALLYVGINPSGSSWKELIYPNVMRDPAAWYNLVVAYDTTESVEADRVKVYINGNQITASSGTYPSLNEDTGWNASGYQHTIGRYEVSDTMYFDGCVTHVNFIDGTAYAPTAFGEFDSTSGIWIAKTSPSVTYGDEGAFFKFASGALTTDSSGNSNTLTAVGTPTECKDSPDNNFATWNPLIYGASSLTIANGNNAVTDVATTSYHSIYGTIPVSTGKWYWEIKAVNVGSASGRMSWGIGDVENLQNANPGEVGDKSNGWTWDNSGGYKTGGSGGQESGDYLSYTTGDIIAFALDCDNAKLYLAKNNTWQKSGDPTSGATGTGAISITADTTYAPAGNMRYSGNEAAINFGNGYFGTTAVTSAEADGNGEGQFEYAPPTGYFALCTNNLGSES